MISPLRLVRLNGLDRIAVVSVAPGSAESTWTVRVAMGPKAGKLKAGSVFGPFPQSEVQARFDEVVGQLKAQGFAPADNKLLIAQLHHDRSKVRARAALRLGWMRSKEAVDVIIGRLPAAGDDVCSLLDALGELGDPKAAAAMRPYIERKLLSRRRSAFEALRKLGDAEGLKAARQLALQRLPDAVKTVYLALEQGGDAVALTKVVLAVPQKERGLVLDTLYELGGQPALSALRDVLEQSRLHEPHLWRYTKSIFKRAQLRHDAQTFGWLAHQIERAALTRKATAATVKSGYDGKEKKLVIFGRATKAFVRRLGWRYLRKLGKWRPEQYALTAAEAVAVYHAHDARPARGLYGVWAEAYLLNRVLWGQSPRLKLASRTLKWRCRSAKVVEPQPGVREEPFPEAWDAQPIAYVRLLASAKLPEVHRFAHAGLGRHPKALDQATLEELRRMLEAPFEGTVELGLAQLSRRFDANRPDWVLLQKLLDDERPIARDLGLKWLKLTAHLWTREVTRILSFLDSKSPDARSQAAELAVAALQGAPPSVRDGLAEQILARLKQPEKTAGDHDRYARLATEALSAELTARLGLDELMGWIASGSISVKGIAGTLLAKRPGTFQALGLSGVLGLAESDVLAVRAAAVTLLEGARASLHEQPQVLFALAESRWPDVRTGSVNLLRAADVGRLGLEAIVGLCDSGHLEVQDFGKELVLANLRTLDPQELLFRLAQHPSKNVRRFALDLVDNHLRQGFVPLARLEMFFRAALFDLWPDREIKRRVLRLLAHRGTRDENQAELAVSVLKDFVRTAVKNDFELAAQALVSIKAAFPLVDTGLEVAPP